MNNLDVEKLIEKFHEEEKENENRRKKFFPESDDILAIVLRGHLLVEEYIDNLNCHCFHYPEYYEKAKLSFSKKLLIAQAQVLVPHPDFFFSSLSRLNELRNNLAHNLDSPKLTNKITSFVEFIENEYSEESKESLNIKERTIENRIQSSISFILGQLQVLDNVIEFMEKSRAYGSNLDKKIKPR